MRAWMLMIWFVPLGAWAEETTWSADDVQKIEVQSASANIRLIAEERADVAIHGEPVKVRREGSRLYIRALGADVSIRIPRGRMVTASSRSGDLWVKGDFKRFLGNSASGDIEIEGQAEDITIESLSGDLTVHGRSSTLRAESISGEIVIRAEVVDDFRARTTSGDIQLDAALPRRIDVQTVSGDVGLRGTLPTDATLDVRTISGDVELVPRASAGFRVLARTKSGDLHVDGATLAADSRTIDAQIGGGRARLEITTLSGYVRIDR